MRRRVVLGGALLALGVVAVVASVSWLVGVPPASPPTQAQVPQVAATATWPAMDVPRLLDYELAEFDDLSGRTLNVADFGATGDGTTDDTEAVQQAVRAAAGGTLYFPPGVYRLSSVSLDGGTSIRLLGAGQGATVLEHADGATLSMLQGGSRPVHQLQVEQLTLDGNMQRVPTWEVAALDVGVDRLLVDGIEARHTLQQAIRLRTTTATSVIRNSWFHDFQLHGPIRNQDTRAVQVDHDVPSDGDVWFIGNHVEMTSPPAGAGNSVGGLRSSGDLPTRLLVWNNVFRNMGQDITAPISEYIAPIDIYRDGDGSVIWQNRVEGSYYDGIRVMRSSNVQILDNVVAGEGDPSAEAGAGIHLEGREPHIPMHDITVRGNSVSDMPHFDGIRGDFDADGRASNVSVIDNHVTGVRYGVYLSYVAGQVVVAGNDFGDFGGFGALVHLFSPTVRIVNTDASLVADVR